MVCVPDVLSVPSLRIWQVWIVLGMLQLLEVVVGVQRWFSIWVEGTEVLADLCRKVVEAEEEV